MAEKGCDNCYYEFFDARAYPCSLCIRGVERQDMWQEKIRDCRWTVELNRDDESCKRIHDLCKKCKESAARHFDGERYIVCTKVGTPPKHIICFELSECPLKKWEFEDEPHTIRCPNCERTDYIRDMEKDMGIKGSAYKYKCINCNTYIKDEPQTDEIHTNTHECVKNTHDKDEPKICDTCRYYNSNIPCGTTPSACKKADKFAEEFVDGLKKLKPKTDHDRGKQDALTELMEYTYGMLTAEKVGLQHKIKSMMDEPQTDGYMTAEQAEDYRKMLDKAEHKVYGNIDDEPQTERRG